MGDVRSDGNRFVLLGAIVVLAIGLVGFPAVAAAQQEQPVKKEIKEEVVVTGTLIPRPTLEAMSPVTTMETEALTYAGNTRLEDMLTTLPQIFSAQNSSVSNGSSGTATVNLRNMGSNRTLVLIDGVRMPPGDVLNVSPDLNFIPAGIIKRVDILTGGASSTYGADAVAGVVNFVVDKDFEGIRAGIYGGGYNHDNRNKDMEVPNTKRGFSYPTGMATDGGQFEGYFAIGGKFAEGKGHGSLYLDYRKNAALLKGRRDYTNCSVEVLGATGLACGGSSTSPSGRFWPLTGDYSVDPAGTRTFVPWVSSKYTFNYAPYNYMQRPDTRWAGGGFLNYELNPHFNAYGSIMLMDDQTDAQIAPSGDFGNSLYINCDNPMMSDQQKQLVCGDNGYGPGIMGPDGVLGHADLQILRRNVEGGGRNDSLSHQSLRLVGGVKGELGSGWSYDLSGLFSQTRTPETYQNDFNINNIQAALFVEGDPNDPTTWRCTDPAARAAGCVPWDIFQKGKVTQAALNYLSLPLVREGVARTQMITGTLNADLGKVGWTFPSATEGVSLALGADYRKEFLNSMTDLAYQQFWGAGQGGPVLPVRGFYDVKEAFVEALIPFVQGAKGAQDLSLALGYRYSDYNVNGVHPTYKGEMAWAPSLSFKVRAGFNRATRAPNIVELYTPQGAGLGGNTDPCAVETIGETPEFTPEQCLRTGVPLDQYGKIVSNPAGQYNTLNGGNPLLQPETADTTTIGLVFTPSGTSLSVALDYYDIKMKETIGVLNADSVVTQCGLTGDPFLCGLIHRDRFYSLWRTPQGYTSTLNDNVGKRTVEGVDLNAAYTLPAGNSFFAFNLSGTYLSKSFIDTGLYTYDCVGWYGNTCNDFNSDHVAMQPKWRHLFRVAWQTGNTVLTLGWRYTMGMKAEESSDQSALSNPGLIPTLELNKALTIPAFHWFDLSFGFQMAKGVQFNVGINNIFDKEPPLGAGNSANNYAAGFLNFYDSYGRYLHSSIQFAF